MTSSLHQPVSWKSPLLWAAFLLYLSIAGFAMANHEMWADELHSWNIAKGSNSFIDVFRNSRFEGHPPVWYIILWAISKFTHSLVAVQVVHLVIAAVPVFLILFYSKIPVGARLLLPFGYFLLFEYAVLSRNYAVGVLLACLICVIMRRHSRYKTMLYYALLLLLANTHLLATLLAGSLHIYFLLWQTEQKKNKPVIAAHVLLGLMVALTAVYFVWPPSGSVLHVRVDIFEHLMGRTKTFMQAPLRSMLPVPAWWTYHWWNTQFLVEAKEGSSAIRILGLVTAIALPVLAYFIFSKERKSRALFFAGLLFHIIIALTVVSMITARYSGFIFMGFVLSLWLYCEERPLEPWKKITVHALLAVQVLAGVFAVIKDIQYPFSNSYRISELVKEVPPGKKLVCDYWAVNTWAAFIDKPVYCIDMQKEAYYVLFDDQLRERLQQSNRYVQGMSRLNDDVVYMISTLSPDILTVIDRGLLFRLIDKREGAIEKFGNLYLYELRK
jgi:hypothetical protein